MRGADLVWCLGLVALPITMSGCEEPKAPVAELSVDPMSVELQYPYFSRLRFAWHILAELPDRSGEVRVFVHLKDQEGEVVRTFDHDLPFPWRPGDRGEYETVIYQSALVGPLSAGEYAVIAGLYDEAGNRWPLTAGVAEIRPNEYRVATLSTAALGAPPKFFFSAAWLPLEEGADQQVLGRRRLVESGSLRIAELPGPGEVWLQLAIPRPSGGEELVLEAGAAVPSVRVQSTCGGFATELAGAGSRQVIVPVSGLGGDSCDIAFETNFFVESSDGTSRQTVVLEGLAWSAAVEASDLSG